MDSITEKIMEYLKSNLSETEFNRCTDFCTLALKVADNRDVDKTIIESAALLHEVGIDKAFEIVINLNIPLAVSEKICNCLNPDYTGNFPERALIQDANILKNLELLEG